MPSDEQRRVPAPASGADLDGALATAERLLDLAERTSERVRAVRVIEAGVVAVTVFVVTGWDGLERLAGWPRLTVVSVIGAAVGAFLVAAIYLLLEIPLRRRQARDARAAVEIGELIRELMPNVARTEHWNELQLDVFRLRLTRFPLDRRSVR